MPEDEVYMQECDTVNENDCYYFGCRFIDECKRRRTLGNVPGQAVCQETFQKLWTQLRLWLQHERDMANDNRYFAHGSAFSAVLDRMFLLQNSQQTKQTKVG